MVRKKFFIRIKVKGLKLVLFFLGISLRDYIYNFIREIDFFRRSRGLVLFFNIREVSINIGV